MNRAVYLKWTGLLASIAITAGSAVAADLEEHRRYAQAAFEQAPAFFPEEHRNDILAGVIALGMSPAEAQLSGGGFHYGVTADPKVWPKNANPLQVLGAQTAAPDDSKIWMAFRNTTQFGTAEPVPFRVHFVRGRVHRIERD